VSELDETIHRILCGRENKFIIVFTVNNEPYYDGGGAVGDLFALHPSEAARYTHQDAVVRLRQLVSGYYGNLYDSGVILPGLSLVTGTDDD